MKSRASIYFKIAAGLFALIFISGISAKPSDSNDFPKAFKESGFQAAPTGGSGTFERVAPDPLIVSPVPEPGTVTLLAVAGVGGLALALRRRRQN